MSSGLIGAIVGGIIAIIAAVVGAFAHYLIGDRRLKKRLCSALCEELDYNIERLKRAVTLDENRYSTPYHFLSNSYLEARNRGILRELPKEIRNLVEEYYSFLQFVNTYWLGCLMREEPTSASMLKKKNPTEDEVAKQMDEVLPRLKEFCCHLRVWPHHDVVYTVRRIRRMFKGRSVSKTVLLVVGGILVGLGLVIMWSSYTEGILAIVPWEPTLVALGVSTVSLGIAFWGLSK